MFSALGNEKPAPTRARVRPTSRGGEAFPRFPPSTVVDIPAFDGGCFSGIGFICVSLPREPVGAMRLSTRWYHERGGRSRGRSPERSRMRWFGRRRSCSAAAVPLAAHDVTASEDAVHALGASDALEGRAVAERPVGGRVATTLCGRVTSQDLVRAAHGCRRVRPPARGRRPQAMYDSSFARPCSAPLFALGKIASRQMCQRSFALSAGVRPLRAVLVS